LALSLLSRTLEIKFSSDAAISKAAAGILPRSMGAALQQKTLDAVILRVWMRRVAVSNVLATLDLSLVEIFQAAQEAKQGEPGWLAAGRRRSGQSRPRLFRSDGHRGPGLVRGGERRRRKGGSLPKLQTQMPQADAGTTCSAGCP
ncbi:MAG: hypothetical protein ACKPKO_05650, partial [Candidatus Fonsibacter sp.]